MKLSKTLFLILIAVCFTFTANIAANETIRKKTDSAKKSTVYKIIHLCSYGDICVCPSEIFSCKDKPLYISIAPKGDYYA